MRLSFVVLMNGEVQYVAHDTSDFRSTAKRKTKFIPTVENIEDEWEKFKETFPHHPQVETFEGSNDSRLLGAVKNYVDWLTAPWVDTHGVTHKSLTRLQEWRMFHGWPDHSLLEGEKTNARN